MCIVTKELFIYDEYTARDFLRDNGIDDYQHDEFIELVQSDNVLDMWNELENLRTELKSYEASLDAAHGLFNDILTLCLDLQDKARTKDALKAIEAIYNLVHDSEAFARLA